MNLGKFELTSWDIKSIILITAFFLVLEGYQEFKSSLDYDKTHSNDSHAGYKVDSTPTQIHTNKNNPYVIQGYDNLTFILERLQEKYPNSSKTAIRTYLLNNNMLREDFFWGPGQTVYGGIYKIPPAELSIID